MGKRKAPFDPPTQADFDSLGPDRVAKGPKGGFIWRCDKEGCRRLATALSSKGEKICKRHGGSTSRQRDPAARALAAAKGEKIPNPPGRPAKHGFYSIVPGIKVDELVAEYRERKLNPDATDDDMLYLRAYLDELKLLRPDSQQAAEMLREALPLIRGLLNFMTDEENFSQTRKITVREAFEAAAYIEHFRAQVDSLKELLKALIEVTAGVEMRHKDLVMLAKVRAETRLKDSAAAQLDAFTTMVEKLVIILAETLPSSQAEAVTARLAKELTELSHSGVKVKA